VPVNQAGAQVGGEEEGAVPPLAVVEAEKGRRRPGPGVSDALRQLDLYRAPEEETLPGGPLSHRPALEAPPWDDSLVAVWEGLAEGADLPARADPPTLPLAQAVDTLPAAPEIALRSRRGEDAVFQAAPAAPAEEEGQTEQAR